MCPLQSQERSEQNEKRGDCKSQENFPLKSQCFKEDVPVSEGSKPEHVHVIRQTGPTTEEDDGKHEENEKEAASASRLLRMRGRPVKGLSHCFTPFCQLDLLSASYALRFRNLPLLPCSVSYRWPTRP